MYFSKFPILEYPVFTGDKVNFVVVSNILRRVALSEQMRDGSELFLTYNIKDGERPEHIAERVYGNPNLHWIVLLTNTIIDPYHGWYKSGAALEDIILKKYGGQSLFFTGADDGFLYDSAFSAGCTLSQGGLSDSILIYEPTLCKIVITKPGFVVGAATIKTPTNTTHSIKIQRIFESYRAVNHFEIEKPSGAVGVNDVFTVDPLSEALGTYQSTLSGVVNLGDVVGDGVFGETYIGKYMGLCGGTPSNNFVVINSINEMTDNDSKRTIKILHPRFKDIAVEELQALLRV